MKKSFIFALCFLSMVMLVLFSGCKKDQEQAPETFVSDKARPVWTAPEKHDMTSMTAVVKVDLKTQYPNIAADFALNDNDLLGAFSGEQCLGVAQLQEGYFLLYIDSPEAAGSSQVTLRYYSAQYKNLFEAKDAFPFVNGDHPGTIAEPFIPSLVVVK